jgi:GMP synthase (glutamine-hydrolysing)
MILIIDFGSQTTHLIGRRIKDLGVNAEIISPENAVDYIRDSKPKGIILSGGPDSVYQENSILIDKQIFNFGIPVLGICYGLQLMSYFLGGEVVSGKKKEYGPAILTIKKENPLFFNLPDKLEVWMSHGDEVKSPPKGAVVSGCTQTIKVASFAWEEKNFYGVQFHPEVQHTPKGMKILENFVFGICREIAVDKKIDIKNIITKLKEDLKGKAVCALSGGIDSAVAAVLSSKAIGDDLTCFYVDTGLMRYEQTKQVEDTFKKHFRLNLQVIYAKKEFLKALKGVVDPEEKRKVVGETFIRIFEKEAKKIKAKYLVQGTIYPDVIESKGTKHSDKIKTHHNVGGIPEYHSFTIVEPLKYFYKDEVRSIAKELSFPETIIHRHVYPGPGLAVRVIGEVTEEKLDILRQADRIVVEEIKKAGIYNDIWMAFAVFSGIKTTGVGGDERKYGETIAVRVIESKDTMTADWVRLPYKVLARISNRITNEVFQVVRVVYDITTKPPSTMEWE